MYAHFGSDNCRITGLPPGLIWAIDSMHTDGCACTEFSGTNRSLNPCTFHPHTNTCTRTGTSIRISAHIHTRTHIHTQTQSSISSNLNDKTLRFGWQDPLATWRYRDWQDSAGTRKNKLIKHIRDRDRKSNSRHGIKWNRSWISFSPSIEIARRQSQRQS